MVYNVMTNSGQAIYEADSIAEARRDAADDVGKNNVLSVKRATKEDLDWVAGMGGWVPN